MFAASKPVMAKSRWTMARGGRRFWPRCRRDQLRLPPSRGGSSVEVELAGVALGGGEQDIFGVGLLARGGQGGSGSQLQAEDAEELPVKATCEPLDGGPLLRESPGCGTVARTS
ncbi:MAG: hypothetical protein IPJ59_27660 [Nannocystis sp.]|nr:hypothetical protein [Nannocystis sp.]